jgi:hypothetical protein
MLKSRDAPSCTCGERSGAGAPENLLVLSPVQFILQRAVSLTGSSFEHARISSPNPACRALKGLAKFLRTSPH